MVDLAELTLTVSSDGVDEGTRSLQALEKAARGAEAASQKFATLAEKAWRASGQAVRDAAEAARSAVTSFRGMDEAALRVHNLRSKFDDVYRSASKMEMELQDLAEAERLGVQITGGYSQALDRLILKHDKAAAAAAKQVQIYKQLAAAERLAATSADSQAHYNSAVGINLGTDKSARDSAAVFKTELDELDRIAKLKAKQIGDNFSSQLNASLIAGTSKSARDSASVFKEQFRETEQMAAAAERLRGRINPLHAAQSRLNDELQHYNTLARGGYITTHELAKAQRLAQTQYQITAKAISEQGVAYASNRAQMANTVNLTHQLQDVAITAAMGMNPLTIALQQGTQASMAFQGANPAEAVNMLVGAFKSLLSVTALSTIGIIAVTAAVIQIIDWSAVASTVLVTLASVIESVAPYAATAAAGLALLYAPAILGGLTILSEAILTLTARLIGLGVGFAAANPGVALILGLAAVVTAANIFREEITQIFGFDIVGIVKDAANYIVNSFFAAFEDVKFVWNNFGDIFGGAVIGGVNIAIRAIDDLLIKAAEGINWLIRQANKVPRVNIDEIDTSGGVLEELENPYAERLEAANAEHASRIEDIMSRDTIGDFGSAIARGATYAADKLKELASSLGRTGEEAEKAARKAEREAERQQKAYDRLVLSANQFIEQKKFETEALFMTEEAAARLRKEQEYLNSAQRSNIDLTPKMRQELIDLAHAAADAETQFKKTQEALQFGKDVIKGFFSNFRSSLEEGKGFWESFADAAVNALQKIADKLIDMALDQMINNFLGSIMGAFGGGLGGGLGGGYFPPAPSAGVGLYHTGGIAGQPAMMRSVDPAIFMNAPRYHNGGIAGLRPNEVPAILERGERIIPANANHSNNNQLTINVNVSGARGNAEIEEMVYQGVASGLSKFPQSKAFQAGVQGSFEKLRSTRGIR